MNIDLRELELAAHGLKTTGEIGFPLRLMPERQIQIGEWLAELHKRLVAEKDQK